MNVAISHRRGMYETLWTHIWTRSFFYKENLLFLGTKYIVYIVVYNFYHCALVYIYFVAKSYYLFICRIFLNRIWARVRCGLCRRVVNIGSTYGVRFCVCIGFENDPFLNDTHRIIKCERSYDGLRNFIYIICALYL